MPTKLKTFSIRNAERDTVLATDARLASVVRRAALWAHGPKGRRRRRRISADHAARPSTRSSCASASTPIFIDKDNRVVKIVPGMRQWWLAFGGRGAKDVIELPAGIAERTGTQPGDILAFEGPSRRAGVSAAPGLRALPNTTKQKVAETGHRLPSYSVPSRATAPAVAPALASCSGSCPCCPSAAGARHLPSPGRCVRSRAPCRARSLRASRMVDFTASKLTWCSPATPAIDFPPCSSVREFVLRCHAYGARRGLHDPAHSHGPRTPPAPLRPEERPERGALAVVDPLLHLRRLRVRDRAVRRQVIHRRQFRVLDRPLSWSIVTFRWLARWLRKLSRTAARCAGVASVGGCCAPRSPRQRRHPGEGHRRRRHHRRQSRLEAHLVLSFTLHHLPRSNNDTVTPGPATPRKRGVMSA